MPVMHKTSAQSAEQSHDFDHHPCGVSDLSTDRIQPRRTWRARGLCHGPDGDATRAPPAITTLDVEGPPITTNAIIVTVQQTVEPQGHQHRHECGGR